MAAVAAARKAFEGPWGRFSPAQRQQVLIRFADLVDKHYDELATIESLDMGAPLARLRGSKDNYIRNILYYSSQARAISGVREPSCVLLDVRMAGLSGLVMFEKLIAYGLLPTLPVIFLTGHADVPTAVDAVKRGAFDFYEKTI